MFTNDGYALLIGVDDYSTFDISRGQPVGTHDLRGSRNDVRTFWRLCRLIGIKPANIRVLTSPLVPFGELEGASSENVALATEAEILAKTGWLAEKLAQAGKPTGVLTYSGHGDWLTGKGLVLCPSDVSTGPGGEPFLAHAVPFRALNARLARHAENLTVVLDTCHSGAATIHERRPGKIGKPLALTQRLLSDLPGVRESGHAPELEALSGRVLAAARRDQLAYQSMFDGHYRGVFSWAVSVAVEQWRATQQGSSVRVDLSYGKLVETTQRLIASLWFDQTPELHGPAGVADLAVLQRGLAEHPGETSSRPDGSFEMEQIDPGGRGFLLFTVTQNGVTVGQVVVTNTAGAGFAADTESWYMTGQIVNDQSLTFTGSKSLAWSELASGLGKPSFTMARIPTWTRCATEGTMPVYSNPLTGEYDGIDWQMTETDGVWSGQITWWHSSMGNLFGAGVTRTLVATPTSGTYYRYVSKPL